MASLTLIFFLTLVLKNILCLESPSIHLEGKNQQREKIMETGPRRLSSFEMEKQDISHQETKGILIEYPERLTVYTFKRQSFSRLCYNGGVLDPNTGCTEKIVSVGEEPHKIAEMIDDGYCEVGYECAPYGDCWGSWANERCMNYALVAKVKKDTTIKWIDAEWKKFPYHTCIQSWECIFHKATVPAFVHWENDRLKVGVTLTDSHFFNAEEEREYTRVETEDGFTHIIRNPHNNKKSREVIINCLGSVGIGTFCKLKRGDPASKLIFFIKPGKNSSQVRNFHLVITGKVLTVGEANMVSYDMETNEITPYVSDVSVEGKSATVDDIMVLANSLHFTALQSSFNVYQLHNAVDDISDKITKLIGYLMPRNPDLLGYILTKNIRTRNLNPTIFKIREYKDNTPTDSNCLGPFIYKDGALVKRGEKDLCDTIIKSAVEDIHIFMNFTLDKTVLQEEKFNSITKEEDAWSWLVSYKQLRGSPTSYSQGDQDSFVSYVKNSLSSLINPLTSVSKYFCLFSCIVMWINLIISFCLRTRG